jgi:hypothetical protein
MDALRGLDERGGPSLELAARGTFERRVSLAQDPPIQPPSVEVSVFHVEHTPVEESAALARSALDQLMDAGLDDVHRQNRGKLGCTDRRISIYLLLQPPGIECHADPHGPLRRLDLAVDAEAGRPGPYELPNLSRTKGAPSTEQVDAFEGARFPGAVRPE